MTAQSLGYRIRYRRRTDWFRVLADLQSAGYDNTWVATTLDVPNSTLRGWKAGGEPAHGYGHDLLELWCEITQRRLRDRPMTSGP